MDDELEFTDEQLARIDRIENAAYELICALTYDNYKMDWDISLIGDVADMAADYLVKRGYRVKYPAIVECGNNSKIEEYY